jgi:hypothetical protein
VTTVIADSTRLTEAETFSHACDVGGDPASRGKELSHWIESILARREPIDAAVLYEQDFFARAKLTNGTKARLRLEGATIAALSSGVSRVEVKDGPGLGALVGPGGKAGAMAEGAGLSLGADYNEAASAALAAIALVT